MAPEKDLLATEDFFRDLALRMKAHGYQVGVVFTYEEVTAHPRAEADLSVELWASRFLAQYLNLEAVQEVREKYRRGRIKAEHLTEDFCFNLLMPDPPGMQRSMLNQTQNNARDLCRALSEVLETEKARRRTEHPPKTRARNENVAQRRAIVHIVYQTNPRMKGKNLTSQTCWQLDRGRVSIPDSWRKFGVRTFEAHR